MTKSSRVEVSAISPEQAGPSYAVHSERFMAIVLFFFFEDIMTDVNKLCKDQGIHSNRVNSANKLSKVRRIERKLSKGPCGGTCLPGFEYSTRHGCSHFQDLTDINLSVVRDVSVDLRGACSDFVSFEISRFSLLEVLIGVRLHTCIRRGEYACVYVSAFDCILILKKTCKGQDMGIIWEKGSVLRN